MATISKKHYEHGDTLTAATLNAPYDALEIAAGDIDDDNTGSGWITRKHFNAASSSPTSRLYNYMSSDDTAVTYTDTAWTTIENASATLAQIDIGSGFRAYDKECLRLSASGLVTETFLDSSDVTGVENYYAFRLVLTINDGSGDSDVVVGQWGYSFTTRALATDDTGGNFSANKIQYQTFQFQTLYQVDGDTVDVKKLRLQVAVNTAGYTVDIARHQLFLIGGRA